MMAIQNRKLKIFLNHKSAVFGLFVISVFSIMALFPTVLATHRPNDTYNTDKDPKGYIKNDVSVAQPPSLENWFGTDKLGRDVYSNIVYGAVISLKVGFVAVAISLIFGVLIGGLAGYQGGYVDSLLMRLMDVMLSFPSILLALLIVTMLGRGTEQVMIAVGVAGVPRFARQMRAEVVGLKEREFILACHALGFTGPRIFFKHILPNSLGPLTVLASLGVATAVLEAAGLGFLGLGAPTGDPEWGVMLADNRADSRLFPWLVLFPGFAIALTVLGFNLVGDGIRDAFDPTTTQR